MNSLFGSTRRLETTVLVWAVITSSIGILDFIYALVARDYLFLLTGVALLVVAFAVGRQAVLLSHQPCSDYMRLKF